MSNWLRIFTSGPVAPVMGVHEEQCVPRSPSGAWDIEDANLKTE